MVEQLKEYYERIKRRGMPWEVCPKTIAQNGGRVECYYVEGEGDKRDKIVVVGFSLQNLERVTLIYEEEVLAEELPLNVLNRLNKKLGGLSILLEPVI